MKAGNSGMQPEPVWTANIGKSKAFCCVILLKTEQTNKQNCCIHADQQDPDTLGMSVNKNVI